MGEPVLAPVEQRSLRESVYVQLHDAFTRGEFAPGDILSLRSLAAQLGTSLTPVREAVRRLVAEGALIDTSSRTLKVPDFDRARMTDLKHARLALEPLVLKFALQKRDAGLVAELENILAKSKSSGDQSGMPDLEQNYNFHFTLYRASNSPVLVPLIDGLWLQYGPYLNLIVQMAEKFFGTGNEFHEEIIQAIKDRDNATAKRALIEDINRCFDVLDDFQPTGA